MKFLTRFLLLSYVNYLLFQLNNLQTPMGKKGQQCPPEAKGKQLEKLPTFLSYWQSAPGAPWGNDSDKWQAWAQWEFEG